MDRDGPHGAKPAGIENLAIGQDRRQRHRGNDDFFAGTPFKGCRRPFSRQMPQRLPVRQPPDAIFGPPQRGVDLRRTIAVILQPVLRHKTRPLRLAERATGLCHQAHQRAIFGNQTERPFHLRLERKGHDCRYETREPYPPLPEHQEQKTQRDQR